MTKARIDQLKSQVAAMSSNPLMDTVGNGSTLNTQLQQHRQSSDQAASWGSLLSSQLSQAQGALSSAQREVTQAQSALSNLQSQCRSLEQQKQNNQALTAKINSYLGDFQASVPTQSSGSAGDEALAQQLAGELAQLTME